MYIVYVTTAAFSVGLLALIFALVFNRDFRRDLTAPAEGNHVSIAGLSVQGAVIVVLVALMIAALAYVVQQHFESINDSARANLPHIPISELPFAARNKDDAISQIRGLQTKASNIGTARLHESVALLKYNSEGSEEIRNLVTSRRGPWGVSDKSKETYLTVPAKIPAGEAWACPSALNKKFELRSRLPNAADLPGESLTINFAKMIISSDDCDAKFDHIHVACDIAVKVLSDRVLACDAKNQPKWKNIDPKAPIFLTEVAA